jgi:5-deoxy-D-glucuronate isomerase
MSEQFKKIIELIKQTGDKVIVFDAASPDSAYVVMDFDSYSQANGQKAVAAPKKPNFTEEKAKTENLTEEDLTDKINREISMWKNQENAPVLSEEDKVKKNWQIPPAVKSNAHNIE